ncbi:hypothetical protein SDC9_155190 [bioreactor metagenome]|jgi:hypothetical protein|uniref:Uncharacterized protein n=1 Tax=bioreactor metagenome TaxID=1076179 RepID=A0A645F0R9_9ZZZZ
MKAKRGRPKLNCRVHQVRFTLSLREGEDDDLLSFFVDIPERRRAAALKSALRAGGVHLESASVKANDDLDLTIQGLVFG